MQSKKHFTTRRGFIAASGFGGLGLYGLWAAYGAAPGPLALLGLDHPQSASHAQVGAENAAKPAAEGAHAAHGGGAAQGPSVDEFSRMTAEFAERYRMPDGSVYPRRMENQASTTADPPRGAHHAPPLTMSYPPNLTPILGMVERLQWSPPTQTRTQAMGTVPCRVERGNPLMC